MIRAHRRGRRGSGLVSLVVALGFAVAGALLVKPEGRAVQGTADIVDGDSLRMAGEDIRIKGIDAPELRQTCRRDGRSYACGQVAREELIRMISSGPVRCRVSGRDRYGRSLAHCRVGDRDVGASLVERGFAVGYGDYAREEATARSLSRGLWAGEFQRPDAWRRERS
jgi:endonuclease YncB( thermonuclease family)